MDTNQCPLGVQLERIDSITKKGKQVESLEKIKVTYLF